MLATLNSCIDTLLLSLVFKELLQYHFSIIVSFLINSGWNDADCESMTVHLGDKADKNLNNL